MAAIDVIINSAGSGCGLLIVLCNCPHPPEAVSFSWRGGAFARTKPKQIPLETHGAFMEDLALSFAT